MLGRVNLFLVRVEQYGWIVYTRLQHFLQTEKIQKTPIRFSKVASQQNFWPQDLYLEVDDEHQTAVDQFERVEEAGITKLAKGVQKTLFEERGYDPERCPFAPPCKVPHLSLLYYSENGHRDMS